jgi:hypothetical protein
MYGSIGFVKLLSQCTVQVGSEGTGILFFNSGDTSWSRAPIFLLSSAGVKAQLFVYAK